MPKKPTSEKKIESFEHGDASRRNIPPVEYQTMLRNQEKAPLQVAYERRNPDLDPQLIWRGKDLLDDSPLVVNAPPLYIQEKIHPKVLIDDLKRRSKKGEGDSEQIDLFSAFDGLLSEEAKTEFYQHDQNWSNRMILGDSLQVMASLAEREGLRGKVQCIYFDPPYGIRFNSNFQWSTTTRDVQDGKSVHITREPEQVKAFRDTWKDGIHSYLAYLKERLTVARELLKDDGSIFVQISDENLHRVRLLMDEVFGESCFVVTIPFKKKGNQKSNLIDPVNDYIVWYGKGARKDSGLKFRPLFQRREYDSETLRRFNRVALPDGREVPLSKVPKPGGKEGTHDYRNSVEQLFTDWPGSRLFYPGEQLTSGGIRPNQSDPVEWEGNIYKLKKGLCWKTTTRTPGGETPGMERLKKARRLSAGRGHLNYKRFLDDFGCTQLTNWWDAIGGAADAVYVVQTNEEVIKRCILMTTDPGDLVLDPTCGSGTTASVAEQWGRRWITIDTSRVALALARARIMGSTYPWFILSDSEEGLQYGSIPFYSSENKIIPSNNIKYGFIYEQQNHIVMSAIAGNAQIDEIWENWRMEIDSRLKHLSKETGSTLREWEITFDIPTELSHNSKSAWKDIWEAKTKRQKEIDKAISANSELKLLYDKPIVAPNKVRVSGPLTIESLSPHRTMIINEDDSLVDPHKQGATAEEATDFAQMILTTLRTAGVQQAHKEDKILFESLEGWPGNYIAGKGFFREVDDNLKTAGIFIGPEFGTVARVDLVEAARECADAGFDVLISCAFNYEAQSTEFDKLGPLPVLKARMNADLHMQPDLKDSGKGNLFVIFGEPDIEILDASGNQIQVKINGVDVYDPSTGEVRSDEPATIACWFIDTDYSGESFFVRQAYFLGQNDPYKSLKISLKAEIDADGWESLNSDTSVPFAKPSTGRIAVKVINHLGDEVMKVYRVD